ncbi:DUF3667 domain-containing protein [Polaribacter undariae]|uniref:DUF3667 domain-containing protein n=1 Tax=Polaribacter sejongensis TaxID=985043 RepID=A0AAJ1QY55_9FLAO|nr:DUF3667 domain-containing protein [Polaribacter undariae]MDN3620483.1 DUF3667 domain-containing protein [Polaribacter undariae]UWD31312.1 DUF3667 domain-containing protein [Polaribacter undariae]
MFNFDAKFWKTLIPLLIRPGEVSKNYIAGKRQRYSNPFKFYLTVSVIFFLIIGITDSYNDFNNFRNGKNPNNTDIFNAINLNLKEDQKKDSILNLKETDSTLTAIKDTISKMPFLKVGGKEIKIVKMLKFQKQHPNLYVDDALDSLKIDKSFSNKFWYSRSQLINTIYTDSTVSKKLKKQFLSYSSIALFILLPLFTLFLKFIYIRSKFTYVEHLIFVFHTQTLFFLLLSIFYILNIFIETDSYTGLFLLLFLLYLFLAMKKFYEQSFIKTLFKYVFANVLFMIFTSLGVVFISFIAFALF